MTNCNDTGAGSLRDVTATAHSGDVIDLSGLGCSTISLATGTLVIAAESLSLKGPGAAHVAIKSGMQPYHSNPVIDHGGHGTLRIDSLLIGRALDSEFPQRACRRRAMG